MNLKYLNRIELDQRIKSLSAKERDLLHEVLLTIKEIDSRRTYLDMGFGSLFDYLVKGVGYSEGSAQRRIDAARLIRELPQVAEKIQSGELKLNQISLVQKASREVWKSQSKQVTAEQKMEVLESLIAKGHSESHQQVTAFFDLPAVQNSYQKVQADESVRVEFTLSKEAFAKVKIAQELLSHSLPTQDIGDFLEYLVDKVIKQKLGPANNSAEKHMAESGKAATEAREQEQKNQEDFRNQAAKIVPSEQITATMAAKSAPSPKDIRTLKAQQKCCQFKDPVTGNKCQSRWLLQVDHQQSRWAGGKHDLPNLQLLCASHNKLKYKKETGIRYL
ncbi:hypothetical protein DOM22_08775 [Bdellovibrio sp. ZAP7]|uniref:HNH endonuclease n=1 Tax=Bdellovibrio sp. ZAP7 TaxID=2231053 RepID=UPI001157A447|nr:DUF222 domain-containing protein [Bdellovibrio sp. ZAP7]QDK45242.1 hypothetical protein DOM22_08775 [Bdellovibrio sp. ZAP7]